ncbi:hypothetical protein [Paenibacillus jilunlii]|uniref:Uncharacterized protein n=1 Tax=Paenibacillus jilunlii TaxID=682956 RepID=A0A1G9WKN7_9BACL|nr:hypothetical protein [Paenibacillus jilunlii]KWX73551.1 hypothetical protein AML91_17915 [Paenibacillus jilunlii]SDM84726.1 hypothetical protein SAMN05216191_119100 [Paenibacillus jilunlii]
MQHLMRKYEEEKCRLNELGQKSLEQGIPLSSNEAVQAQSRKVDELINRMYQEKSGHAGTFRLDFCLGGEMVGFPAWFLQAMQSRLEEVSAHIEHQSEPRQAFEEERKAFQALFASMDIARKPEFEYWEDKLSLKQSVLYERLYLQGLRDGMQLANAFAAPSVLSD